MEWVEKGDKSELWKKSIYTNERESLQDGNEANYVVCPGDDGTELEVAELKIL